MFPLALALFSITAVALGAFTGMILFHLNRYAMEDDRTPLVRHLFLVGSLMFFLLSVFAFLRIPWNELSGSTSLF